MAALSSCCCFAARGCAKYRCAKWSEIDLERRMLAVPARAVQGERGPPCSVVLRSLGIVEALPKRGEYLFHGARRTPSCTIFGSESAIE